MNMDRTITFSNEAKRWNKIISINTSKIYYNFLVI